MTTVQSSTHKKEKTSILKSEVRGYIHNNNNKTKQNIKKKKENKILFTCTRTVRNGSIQTRPESYS